MTSNSRRARVAQDLGLQSRHAYTITKVVEIRSGRISSGIPLVRLRNPHGNNREWRGDWSDNDRNWQMIPSHKRSELGLTFDDDGEFYMSFRDFRKYFGELEICHLTPDSLEDDDNSRKKFEVFHFYGEWKAGETSGGCGNDGNRAFSLNPQFFINLNDPDPYDDVTSCPVIISLMQRQKKRKTEHAIGFKIFKVDLSTKKLDDRALSFNKSVSLILKKYCKILMLIFYRLTEPTLLSTYARSANEFYFLRVDIVLFHVPSNKVKKDNFSSEFLWKNSGVHLKAVEVIKSMMQWMLEVKNALMMLIAVVLKAWLMVFGTLPSKDQTRWLVVWVDSSKYQKYFNFSFKMLYKRISKLIFLPLFNLTKN